MTIDQTSSDCNYYTSYIPRDVMTELEAGAFRSLCSHLRERSDEVQNIDLMTLSGFCRNCLAKWLVVEARNISSRLSQSNSNKADEASSKQRLIQVLDAFGYDEAAEEVYGCKYPEWKKRHAKKASDKQMELFKNSSSLHAKHDKSVLQTRAEKPSPIEESTNTTSEQPLPKKPTSSLLSNICCQDVEEVVASKSTSTSTTIKNASTSSSNCQTQSLFQPPPPPHDGVTLKIGILTVSDRAFGNQYETGDLSGPAVEKSIFTLVDQINKSIPNKTENSIQYNILHKAIVPDDAQQISQTLKQWTGKEIMTPSSESELPSDICNLIFTTGGTGFSPRDVTPEATISVLDRECYGLMSWTSIECVSTGTQPYAPLSRGTAGICGKAMIANLPGNPVGVGEVLKYVFPLIIHAVKDIE